MQDIGWKNNIIRHGERILIYGMPMALHCHHYNINLHKMLEDKLGDEGIQLLYSSAEEATFIGLQNVFNIFNQIRSSEYKLKVGTTIFQNSGLGILELQDVDPRGGKAVSMSNHHVTGWLAKLGRRETPGCHFIRGYIAGMLEAVYNLPLGHYFVEETQCKMVKESKCQFIIKVS
jgi:hypothetical protein